MVIELNFKSGKPVYLQVVDQVKSAVASGVLVPGDPLPSIRPLAEELRVNRNTVLKAYLELENQNVIESFPGKGSFVKRSKSPLRREARHALLNQEIDQAVVAAHHLQVTRADFLKLVNERFDQFEQRRDAATATKSETP